MRSTHNLRYKASVKRLMREQRIRKAKQQLSENIFSIYAFLCVVLIAYFMWAIQ